jgi:nitroimidazol reductase NimA-like FMN-containing flavoprotein (pyridoxamine 5'-phosphate oxidase superfamily)
MKKVRFTPSEREFLLKNESCRIATCKNNIPHVVPVSYIFEDDTFYFATDYGTKKLENIQANGNLALTVDVYGSSENRAVCVQGKTTLIERGSRFKRLYKIFHSRFAWVQEDPWAEGEAPFVQVVPYTKVSWGL